MDDHAVFRCLDICAHFPEIFGHNLNTVGFFDTEFLCIPDNSGFASAKGAITAIIGSSSIRVGMMAPSTVVP